MKSKKREYVVGRKIDDGVAYLYGPFTLSEAKKSAKSRILPGRQVYRLVEVHPAKKRGKG